MGNKEAVTSIQRLLANRSPIAWLLSGEPGTGKTTLAELIAAKVQVQDSCILRVNCAIDNGVAWHRELAERSHTIAWNGEPRVFILNEAQELTGQAQKVWLDVLEDKELPTVLVFTTSEPDKIVLALRQRCAWFALRGLDKNSVYELVIRVIKASGTERSGDDIYGAILTAGITSPRAIVWAIERYASGVSAEEAVQSAETEPLYADIAKATITGVWSYVVPLLKNLKPQDAKGLRQVLSGFLRNSLIAVNNTEAAAALRELALYSSFEAGVDLGAVVAIIHSYCKKKRG